MKQVDRGFSAGVFGPIGATANQLPASSRDAALVSTLRELKAAGFVSRRALADELNRRSIPTARDCRWQYTTVVRMLTRLGMLTSGKGAKIYNGQANKRAADARAKALASTIRELQAKGLVSLSAMAHVLNERKIPTAHGGKWHKKSVSRVLRRLERLVRLSNRLT